VIHVPRIIVVRLPAAVSCIPRIHHGPGGRKSSRHTDRRAAMIRVSRMLEDTRISSARKSRACSAVVPITWTPTACSSVAAPTCAGA
jgi:hypothetical protein